MGSLGSSAQGCVVVQATAVNALSTMGWALVLEVGVTTFRTCVMGREGVLVDG